MISIRITKSIYFHSEPKEQGLIFVSTGCCGCAGGGKCVRDAQRCKRTDNMDGQKSAGAAWIDLDV